MGKLKETAKKTLCAAKLLKMNDVAVASVIITQRISLATALEEAGR